MYNYCMYIHRWLHWTWSAVVFPAFLLPYVFQFILPLSSFPILKLSTNTTCCYSCSFMPLKHMVHLYQVTCRCYTRTYSIQNERHKRQKPDICQSKKIRSKNNTSGKIIYSIWNIGTAHCTKKKERGFAKEQKHRATWSHPYIILVWHYLPMSL